MQFIPEHIYHVYNQGNNRGTIFYDNSDYELFLRKIKKGLSPYCSVLCWCLMPNHFHLLIMINKDYSINSEQSLDSRKLKPLNREIGSILSSYTQLVNKKYGRTGSLFRKRTKSKSISENSRVNREYLINCFLYIHQNPIRAGIVSRMEDWEYSSYKDYCGLRNGTLCNKKMAFDLIGLKKSSIDFKVLSHQTIPPYYLQKLVFK